MANGATLRLELFVRDVDASVRFYADVLRFQIEHVQGSYTAVRRGQVVLGLGQQDNLPRGHYFSPDALVGRKGVGVEVVIEVDDVDADYAHVTELAWPIAVELGARPWGLRDFRIVDPDGYYLRVTSRDTSGAT